MVLKELLHNMLVLVVLIYLYSFLYRYKDKLAALKYNIISGALFGFMTILVLISPFIIVPGVIIDGRTIIIGLAGFLGGVTVVVPAMVISGIFRIIIGGIGTFTGVGIIITSGITGVLYKHFIENKLFKKSYVYDYLFGLLLHIEMMLWMFTLPYPVSSEVINQITIPVLVMFPLVTVLVIQIINEQEKNTEIEYQLQQNERRLIAAEKIASIAHWEDDLLKKSFTVSENIEKILNLRDTDQIKSLKQLRSFINDEYKEYVKAVFEESLQFNRPYNIEFKMNKENGEEVFVNEICKIEYDENGKPVKILGIIQDTTKRKTAEILLRKSEESYRNLFAGIDDAIIVFDYSKKIVNANLAFTKLFLYNKNELNDITLDQLFADDNEAAKLNVLINSQSPFQAKSFNCLYVKKSKRIFTGETKVSLLHAQKNDNKIFIMIVRDITKQLQIADELKDYQQNLEEKIKNRTIELQKANQELVQMTHTFHGREFRINELRIENKKLKKILEEYNVKIPSDFNAKGNE